MESQELVQERLDYYKCKGLTRLCQRIKGWRESKGFETSWLNVPEKLMMIVTEIGEAMKMYRRLRPVPLDYLADVGSERALRTWVSSDDIDEGGWSAESVMYFQDQLAATVIRLFDLAASLGIDLEDAISARMCIDEVRVRKYDADEVRPRVPRGGC